MLNKSLSLYVKGQILCKKLPNFFWFLIFYGIFLPPSFCVCFLHQFTISHTPADQHVAYMFNCPLPYLRPELPAWLWSVCCICGASVRLSVSLSVVVNLELVQCVLKTSQNLRNSPAEPCSSSSARPTLPTCETHSSVLSNNVVHTVASKFPCLPHTLETENLLLLF